MFRLIRFFLTATVLLMLYCIVLTIALGWPGTAWLVFGLIVALGAKMGRRYLTTLGSARWASEAELDSAGMLESRNGLILGRLGEERNR
ncbi:MAG TPA: hypothetical protein VHQ47_06090 [Phycisphaerae bacterium]|jgi:hypothetical protein|nr:hypothetical protein [Phycisphaerae bacterium]